YVFAIHGLKHTNQELRHLANVELEQLVASTRLMQQSEMVASYAHLVHASSSLNERRMNMMELTDRMLWLDKLVTQLAVSDESGSLGSRMLATRETLKAEVDQLGKTVF